MPAKVIQKLLRIFFNRKEKARKERKAFACFATILCVLCG